jgi:hypothetical protein
VLTNPLAHALATALHLDGAELAEDVASIELEMYRVNDIAADDTSCARIRTAAGRPIVTAVTLCAERPGEPYVVVHGDAGRITFWYKADRIRLERPGRPPETTDAWRAEPGTGERGPRRVIPGIDDLTDAGAARLALYSELGAPWAVAPATPLDLEVRS